MKQIKKNTFSGPVCLVIDSTIENLKDYDFNNEVNVFNTLESAKEFASDVDVIIEGTFTAKKSYTKNDWSVTILK